MEYWLKETIILSILGALLILIPNYILAIILMGI